MLRPTTLLRAFAAPSRRILLPQAAALAPGPSSILFRRLQSTTTPPPESDSAPEPSAEAAPSEPAPSSTEPADPSSTLTKKQLKLQKYSKSAMRQASKARKQQRAQQQAEQPPAPETPSETSASPAELSPAEPSSETTQQPAPKQRLRPKIRTPLPGLPYHVSRTPYAELPVYELAKRGGNKKLTNVKKVEGDKAIFRAQLAEGLALAADDITLNTLTGHIVVPGFRRKEVVKWLEAKGF